MAPNVAGSMGGDMREEVALMSTRIRIATFNLENLDDQPAKQPSLDCRIALMRPQLARLDADVLCLQEVVSQKEPDGSRSLRALGRLLEGTRYASGYAQVSTMAGDQPMAGINLVILTRFPVVDHGQYLHTYTPAPEYRRVTAVPQDPKALAVHWERPILYARLDVGGGVSLHVIDVHLKSQLPADVPGQKRDAYTWASASGWAEGFFLSSMRRVGQAVETRMLVDHLFDGDPEAWIVVAGDFNAEPQEVPIEAIRGDVEDTGNAELAGRVMVPCENTVPEPSRYTLLHRGKGRLLDHLLVSRPLLAFYRGSEIHNELLHDESIAFATDRQFPESDHAPFVAEFVAG